MVHTGIVGKRRAVNEVVSSADNEAALKSLVERGLSAVQLEAITGNIPEARPRQKALRELFAL